MSRTDQCEGGYIMIEMFITGSVRRTNKKNLSENKTTGRNGVEEGWVPEGNRDSETMLKEVVINSRKFFKYPMFPALTESCFLQAAEAFAGGMVFILRWASNPQWILLRVLQEQSSNPSLPSTGCFIYTNGVCVSNIILHNKRSEICFEISVSHVLILESKLLFTDWNGRATCVNSLTQRRHKRRAQLILICLVFQMWMWDSVLCNLYIRLYEL